MRVFYIVSVWPEPQSSGASTRVMELISLLQQQDGVELTIASSAAKGPLSAPLASSNTKEVCIALNHSSFDELIKHASPELVIFDRFMTEEQFGWRVREQCPNALRVLDTIDLHLLRIARGEQQKSKAKTLELQSDTALREVAAIYRCDLSLFVSNYEIELLKKEFAINEALLHYHPLLIDNDALAGFKPFEARKDFIAIGNFRHPPNWDAVLRLKKTIWPAIKKALPKTKLHIYGAYPPQKALQLHNEREGFFVHGFVADDRQVMRDARVQLAPLFSGAGIKSKVVLAMSEGTPTVTTSVGAEGLLPDEHWAGAIEDTSENFIHAAIQLYQNEKSYLACQEQGREILSAFDKNTLTQSLVERLANCQKNKVARRRNNFVGQLLNHHQHQSTRFMSKWIEEKNKLK